MEPVQDILQAGMFKAIAETLENMAFMEVERTEDALSPEEESMGVSLLIHDPVQWELTLTMPKQMVLDIASAVYAMEEEDLTEELEQDLLAEILNTVAGRFFSEILLPNETFALGLPEPCSTDDCQSDEAPLLTWKFSADGVLFRLRATGSSLTGLDNKLKPHIASLN
jgi:CheY-specific phosphatase CheX